MRKIVLLIGALGLLQSCGPSLPKPANEFIKTYFPQAKVQEVEKEDHNGGFEAKLSDKTEIKFDNDHTIYALLRSAVKHSLGQFQVLPTIDFSLDESQEVPYSYKDKEAKIPTYQVDRNFNPFKMEEKDVSSKRNNPPFSFASNRNAPQWEALYTGFPSKVNESLKEEVPLSSLIEVQTETKVQTILYFQKKYIITYLKDKVLFIHVSRAHQRILYERFYKSISQGGSISQSLLFPLEFEFSPVEILSLQSLTSSLNRAGFLLEIEQNKIRFTGLPPLVKESQVEEILRQLLEKAMEDIPQEELSQRESLAKNLAKSLAIKAGQSLSPEEQEQLVYDLFSCKKTQVSPFGKKIYIEFPFNELENRF